MALSGAILQGLTRNPLADPGMIGINAGAGLAAVTLIVLLPPDPPNVLPLAAFGGALIVTDTQGGERPQPSRRSLL